MRVVLFHFHLFKNAGTSIDKILEKNFGDKFTQKEFIFDTYERNVEEVQNWIKNEKDKVAFSSHTARLFNFEEFEKREGIKVIPIIFVRHPIIRIHSAYYFEREKQKDLDTLETAIARNTTLKGYIEIRWHIPNDYQCENFHAHRLSDMYYYENIPLLDKALKAIETLPFVGLVEKFDKSLEKLELLVKEYFPDFKAEYVKENVMFDQSEDIKVRLERIREELGDEFYNKVLEKNKEDLIIWKKVVEGYNG